ncbi:MAG: hypothetical protein KatS3mg031_0766 [Chitinophagales bacterium]|nr:MAG: hypothetical protein KatS3mg031_0766 [Chitinophagales bacterium]
MKIVLTSLLLFELLLFPACEKCFKCRVYDSISNKVMYEEPEVSCNENPELHKSVLEKAYQCADCSFTSGNQTFTDTFCGESELTQAWVKEREDNPFIQYTCSLYVPVVTCYEAQ